MLRQGGYAIHDFAACQTYEEYKAMGESVANIYFLENAGPAAQDMEKRLNQQALYLPYAYEYGRMRRNLQKAADALGLTMPDCDAYEQAIEEKPKPCGNKSATRTSPSTIRRRRGPWNWLRSS